MKRTLLWTTLTVAVAALVVVGCQPRTELEPTGEAEQMTETTIEDDVAVTELGGITMTVDGGAWEGPADVVDYVTPVWVEVSNLGDAPLAVEYSNFSLVGAYEPYAALPVFNVELVDGDLVLMAGYEPVTEPEFTAADYYVAPYFAPAYPGVGVWDEVFVYDEDYYGTYLTVWADTPLPTVEMQRAALPEGVLPAGATASGYLFFEKVLDEEEKVNFMAELDNASTGGTLGTLRIPMELELTMEP